MTLADLASWIQDVSLPGYLWYIKRLSGNDTGAVPNAHQSGVYFPKQVLLRAIPQIARQDSKNPDAWFDLRIDSHEMSTSRVRAIWYNNKLHEESGTRDETRITNFGGRESALQNPENTGAIAVFAFLNNRQGSETECRVWVCSTEAEETLIEDQVGPVDPGRWSVWTPDNERVVDFRASSCWLDEANIPPSWLREFPTGAQITEKTLELRPSKGNGPDTRLTDRRTCEYDLFRSIEQAYELPIIRRGFETVDDFVSRAQTILQRRKARAGRSLELHARAIFIEEGMSETVDFSYQAESDTGQKPDFIFPSQVAYRNSAFPSSALRMLAVKTTCKDRWRQILNEAKRIETKHLLTLQEGVSMGQFKEMTESGVRLVVPASLHGHYPESVRPHLITFSDFIREVQELPLRD